MHILNKKDWRDDMDKTRQETVWSEEFGKEYTNRNRYGVEQLDEIYQSIFGITRRALNEEFLGFLDKETVKILEIGCNVGNQLNVLQEQGFQNLYGIEIMPYAVEGAKQSTRGINIIQGSAFDIPFRDEFFDVVFTSGVLIHIHPDDLYKVFQEMIRCSKKYIWGFEYFSEEIKEIAYRENANLLWKGNYSKLIAKQALNLHISKEKLLKRKDEDNFDEMYLIEKGNEKDVLL